MTNFGRVFKIRRAFISHRACGDASENVKRLHATANLNVNVVSSMHFRCVLSTKGRRLLEIYSNNFESCREHDGQCERGQGGVEDLIRKVHKMIKSSL